MQEKHTLPHPPCHAHTSYCSVYKVSKSTGVELGGSSEWYAVQKQWGGGRRHWLYVYSEDVSR